MGDVVAPIIGLSDLAASLDNEPAPPPTATIEQLRAYLTQIMSHGTSGERKRAIEALVSEIRITKKGEMIPVFKIPNAGTAAGVITDDTGAATTTTPTGLRNGEVGGAGGTRTLGLRRATPTLYQLSYNPMPGTGVSNPVSLAPKASGSAVSLVPEVMPPGRPAQAPAGDLALPSTVELRICDAAGHSRGEKQGRQDSNLQPPVLETGALPVELRPCAVVRITKKPPCPWRGGRLRSLRWRYSRRHPGFQFCSLAGRSWARPIESSTTPPRGMNRVVSVKAYCDTENSSGSSDDLASFKVGATSSAWQRILSHFHRDGAGHGWRGRPVSM